MIEIPKRWALKITPEIVKELEAWRCKQPKVCMDYTCNFKHAEWLISKWHDNTYLFFGVKPPDKYKEITLEFFRKNIGKQHIKERIKLLKI